MLSRESIIIALYQCNKSLIENVSLIMKDKHFIELKSIWLNLKKIIIKKRLNCEIHIASIKLESDISILEKIVVDNTYFMPGAKPLSLIMFLEQLPNTQISKINNILKSAFCSGLFSQHLKEYSHSFGISGLLKNNTHQIWLLLWSILDSWHRSNWFNLISTPIPIIHFSQNTLFLISDLKEKDSKDRILLIQDYKEFYFSNIDPLISQLSLSFIAHHIKSWLRTQVGKAKNNHDIQLNLSRWLTQLAPYPIKTANVRPSNVGDTIVSIQLAHTHKKHILTFK